MEKECKWLSTEDGKCIAPEGKKHQCTECLLNLILVKLENISDQLTKKENE